MHLTTEDVGGYMNILSEQQYAQRQYSMGLQDIILNKVLKIVDNTIGKKFTFLIQEVFREINTIGSKNGIIDVVKHVIDMKDELEKIREQAQNIL